MNPSADLKSTGSSEMFPVPASRTHKKFAVLLIPLLLVVALFVSFDTKSKKIKAPLFKLPENLTPESLKPNEWVYRSSEGKDVRKNSSSMIQLPPTPYDERYPTRKALVMASFNKQNMDWIDDWHSDWEQYRYVLDNPDPHTGLGVPRNQGREAMVYLTYIIEHYHNLPNFTVFHHGHNRAWHQVEPTPMKLGALNLTALSQEHYINFRCTLNPGCTPDTKINIRNPVNDEKRAQAILLPKFWDTMFGGDSPVDFGPPPVALSVPCCAQFAVTREAILAHPLSFWKHYRRPLERDLEEYKDIWGELATSYYLGICYEKLWHVLFGKSPMYCPSEDHCRNVQFSDAITCNGKMDVFSMTKTWESIECMNRYQDDPS